MSRKGDARERGRHSRATDGTGENMRRATAHAFTRNHTPTRGARQELARLGSQAERVALRCPNARQRARFERLARFLLDAARRGKP